MPAAALTTAPRATWRGALALCLLLSACGGGGGGGGSANGDTGATVSYATTAFAFPLGVSWAAPTELARNADVTPGATGITLVNTSAVSVPAAALRASQVDAIATGRVALSNSGWLQPAALFDTTGEAHASCWSPAVAYARHDDANSSGTLPAGEVSLWADAAAGDANSACAVAEVNTRLGSLAAQAHQASLLLSALRWRLAGDGALSMPPNGQRIDLSALASSLFQGQLGDASVTAASMSVNGDGTEQTYRLRLSRGSGASAQTLDINLLHTPSDSTVRHAGVLQLALSYLSTNASVGCSDERDANGRYKVARLLTLGYNRLNEWQSLRARSGLYCGNGSALSPNQVEDLASLTLSGELDPAIALSGSSRSGVAGWRREFLRAGSDHLVSTQSGDFILAWQTLPQGGAGHAHLIAGHSTLDTSSGQRSLSLAAGHTDDITTSDGTLHGLVCNLNGPGAVGTVTPKLQWQTATLGSNAAAWLRTASQRRYAPTNSCAASSTMAFDLNGDGTLAANEGASTLADLLAPGSGLDPQDELAQRGFFAPVLLY